MLEYMPAVRQVYDLVRDTGTFLSEGRLYVPCPGADHYLCVRASSEKRSCVELILYLNDGSDGYGMAWCIAPNTAARRIRCYLECYPRKAGYSAFQELDPCELRLNSDGTVSKLTGE